jgi:hypothetical protein
MTFNVNLVITEMFYFCFRLVRWCVSCTNQNHHYKIKRQKCSSFVGSSGQKTVTRFVTSKLLQYSRVSRYTSSTSSNMSGSDTQLYTNALFRQLSIANGWASANLAVYWIVSDQLKKWKQTKIIVPLFGSGNKLIIMHDFGVSDRCRQWQNRCLEVHF